MKKFLEDRNKHTIIYTIISGICLLFSFFNIIDSTIDIAWVAVILCGTPILKEAMIGVVTRFDIRAGVLVSLALIASIYIDAIFVAGEVAFIMQLGEILENTTSKKTEVSIQKLLKLLPDVARVIKDGEESIIKAEEVKEKMILRVNPGETIPVDGIIVKGETSVNQAIMTGEHMPVDKTIGDEVYSGTINQFGSFDMQVTKNKKDSSLQRLINLVQENDLKKAKIIRVTDKWATVLVAIAFFLAMGTWLITGELIRGITILVVFCPCALILATPTAIMAGVGNASKKGALIKNGEILEILGKINTIVFDKTGTLTYGNPEVTQIQTFSNEFLPQEFITWMALVESKSEHIIGKAIIKYAKEHKIDIPKVEVENFKLLVGKGVQGVIENDHVIAGNEKLLKDNNICLNEMQKEQVEKYNQKGSTIVYLAKNKELLGFITLEDVIKEETKATIEQIQSNKMQAILLTGDNERTANNIAQSANISKYYAECIPEDKMKIVEQLKSNNQSVCMVGDGINDAPALKNATVGIAMGEFGSSIAIDAADIVLVSNQIDIIPYLIQLSKKTMKTIRTNLIISLIINLTFVTLSMLGLLTPMQGAIVHNCRFCSCCYSFSITIKMERKEKNIMRTKSQLILFLWCFLMLIQIQAPKSLAHIEDSIEFIEIKVDIQEDGNAIVTETWNVNAIEIPEYFKNMTNISKDLLQDITITDEIENIELNNISDWDNLPKEQRKNKYHIEEQKGGIKIGWNGSEPGFHTYQLKYKVVSFVKQFKDTQGFCFNFLTNDIFPIPYGVSITVKAPFDFTKSNIKAFKSGFEGNLSLQEGSINVSDITAFEKITLLGELKQNSFQIRTKTDEFFKDIKKELEDTSSSIVIVVLIMVSILYVFLETYSLIHIKSSSKKTQ